MRVKSKVVQGCFHLGCDKACEIFQITLMVCRPEQKLCAMTIYDLHSIMYED